MAKKDRDSGAATHLSHFRETFGFRAYSSDMDSHSKKGSARKQRMFRRSSAMPLVHRPFEFRIKKPGCHQQSLARLGHKDIAILVAQTKTAAHYAPSRLHGLGDLDGHDAMAPLALPPALGSVRFVCLRCGTPVQVTLVTAVACAPVHARRVRHATLPAKLCIESAEHVFGQDDIVLVLDVFNVPEQWPRRQGDGFWGVMLQRHPRLLRPSIVLKHMLCFEQTTQTSNIALIACPLFEAQRMYRILVSLATKLGDQLLRQCLVARADGCRRIQMQLVRRSQLSNLQGYIPSRLIVATVHLPTGLE
jgi:hypothetical protein